MENSISKYKQDLEKMNKFEVLNISNCYNDDNPKKKPATMITESSFGILKGRCNTLWEKDHDEFNEISKGTLGQYLDK